MADKTRGRNQDRARVAGGQEYELRYEANKESVSTSKVKETIRSEGNARTKVEEKLEGGNER